MSTASEEEVNKFLAGPASSDEAAVNNWLSSQQNEEQYGTTTEQLKTGLEGAASAATFGLSTKMERLAGVKGEDIRARREENPVSHGVGQAVGLIGSSILAPEGGAAGLLGKAGTAGAEGLGLTGATLGSRLGASAVKQAIEGALFQGGDEISKMLSSDPHQSVGTAALNVGLGGLLGGAVIGGLTGGAGELWNATIGKKLAKNLNVASTEIEARPSFEASAGELTPNIQPTQAAIEGAYAGEGRLLDPVAEASAAAERQGLELPTGLQIKNPTARNVHSELIKRPSFAGAAENKELAEFENQLAGKMQGTLEDKTNLSKFQNGEKIQESLVNWAKKEVQPIEQAFNDLKPELSKVKLTDEAKLAARQKLLNNPMVLEAPNSETAQAYVKAADELLSLDSLSGLRELRTDFGNRLSGALKGEKSNLVPVFKDTKQALTDMRTAALEEAEASGLIKPGTATKVAETDAQYAKFKDTMKQMGVEGGLGRTGTARELMDKLKNKASAESMESRILNPDDYRTTKFFQEKVPEAAELARKGHLRDFYENSISTRKGRDQAFDIASYHSQLNKLEPESMEVLFPGKARDLNDFKTLYTRIPENFNSSNTGAASSFAHLFSPSGLAQEGIDQAQRIFLKALPAIEAAAKNGGDGGAHAAMQFAMNLDKGVDPTAFGQMASYIANVIKGETALNRASKSLFEAGEVVIPSKLLPTEKSRDKLDMQLKHLQANQENLFEVGGKIGHYMPDHGQALSQTVMGGVNYLNTLRPMIVKQSPLDSDLQPNKADIAKYNRALDIAQQPLIALKEVKNGTVTSDDLKTIMAVHPDAYKRIIGKINTDLIDAVGKKKDIPYKTKKGLSLFLGQPLDSTMSSFGIISAQPSPQIQQQKPTQTGMKALDKLPSSSMTRSQARRASQNKI